MSRTRVAAYGVAVLVVTVTSFLLGCGGEDTSGNTCNGCNPSPPCCSTSGGIQVGGVIVPECCTKCPNGSTFRAMDTVTPGGPYLQCTCNGC